MEITSTDNMARSSFIFGLSKSEAFWLSQTQTNVAGVIVISQKPTNHMAAYFMGYGHQYRSQPGWFSRHVRVLDTTSRYR